jgi:hypothetical protein
MTDRSKVVAQIKELAKQEDVEAVIEQLEEKVQEYRRLFEEDKRQKLEAFIADGDKVEDFEMPKTDDDKLFEQLMLAIKDKRKKLLEQKRSTELQNAALKRALLAEFEELLQNDENIGKAFNAFNSIRDRWKNVGHVPAAQYKDLQHEYHKYCERFFYDIQIYKELQQHDLRKNLELKRDLLQRMTKLLEEPSVRETEMLLKAYQVEWDDIGPTFQEDWQQLRDEYFAVVKQLSDKISTHFKSIRDRQKENLQKKLEIIEQAKDILSNLPAFSAGWNEATDKMTALQEEWKRVGFATKARNDEVWKEFKAHVQAFYDSRKGFFAGMREQFSEIEKSKKSLIDSVNTLLKEIEDNASLNWKDATEKVKKLQVDWKKSGILPRGDEQKFYKKFRAQCDAFFERKAEFFKAIDAQKDAAQKAVDTFIEDVEKSEALQQAETARDEVVRIVDAWIDKSKDWGSAAARHSEKLFAKMETALLKAGVAADEAATLLMERRLENTGSAEDKAGAISQESKQLYTRIEKLQEEKKAAENALALFKGNQKHPVFIETGKRIAQLDKGIADATRRLKLLKDIRKQLQTQEETRE